MGERRWYQEVRDPLRDQCREVAHLGFGPRSDCTACGLSKAPHRPDVQQGPGSALRPWALLSPAFSNSSPPLPRHPVPCLTANTT